MFLVNKITYPPSLPISRQRETIIEAIQNNQVVIIAGETGSGKTTQLPKMCLEAGLRDRKVIACTQPRRIAATSVSRRVAEELAPDNDLVGYKIRFDDHTKKSTKIKFLTDGMLLAEATSDSRLTQYDYVIIDEAHERSLNIDFLLGILKKLILKRPQLKIIISSATLDTEKFSKHFNKAPVIEIEGKTFPVEVRYRSFDETSSSGALAEIVGQAVDETIKEDRYGDILIFLPTERDIIESKEYLLNMAERVGGGNPRYDFEVMPLFGRLSAKDQGRIFSACPKRKIVIATNVAETSITVPGIRYVIDSGLARISSYNPRARTTKLPISKISQASADQRKGRCGRVGPGICIRLYSEDDFLDREKFTPPEIVRSNLADVILRMINLRLGDPTKFPFLDRPHPSSIKDGFNLLTELGALRKKSRKYPDVSLTKRGRLMAKLPLDPCISRMIIEARQRNVTHEVVVIAAALSIQDPRVRPTGKEEAARESHKQFAEPTSDFITFLNIWKQYHSVAKKVKSRNQLRKYCNTHYLSPQRMREWVDLYKQICRFLEKSGAFSIDQGQHDHDAIHQSILSGILRNIAFRKEKHLYTGGQGKELMIFPGSAQFGRSGQWIMAAELMETSRLFALTVATINPQWLEALAGSLCRHSYSEPHWQKKRGQVTAYEKVTLFGLIIEPRRMVNYGPIEPIEARKIFIQSALVEGEINRPIKVLACNQKLIRRVEEFEDRARRRNLVDEYLIYQFYEQRLPAQVWDIAGLKRVLPEIESHLTMQEADIVRQDPDRKHLEQFPTEMQAVAFTLKLFYKFEPGSKEDGVSVHIPVEAVSSLDPALFEWLVPGLLADKITLLLKGLPKSLRRQLVPINKSVETIIAQLDFGRGQLHHEIRKAVLRIYSVKLDPVMLREVELTRHLQMRYCLIDHSKKVIKASREFGKLLEHKCKSVPAQFAALKSKWQKKQFDVTELKTLPQAIDIVNKDGTLQGAAFPMLVQSSSGVSLQLTVDRQHSYDKNRQGLVALYKQSLQKQVKAVAKDFVLAQSDWPLFEWFGGAKVVNGMLHNYLLMEVFETRNGMIPDPKNLSAKIAKWQQGEFYQNTGLLFSLLKKILIDRRNTLEHINNFQKKAYDKRRFSCFEKQLNLILPVNFLEVLTSNALVHVCRYFKALRVRIERANNSPQRDIEKEQKLVPFEQKLLAAQDKLQEMTIPSQKEELALLINHLSLLLNEFRVSLFAQELKTSVPVSAKRIEKVCEEINCL